MTYTEEQRDLNGRCSVLMGVQDDFASSPALSRELEDDIERRELEDEYVRALLSVVMPNGSSVGSFWYIIRATPEQRARAYIAAREF